MSEVIERSELILAGPARALGGLLGVPLPDFDGGEALPLLWHWLYTLDRPAQADLGPNGSPVRDALPPPPGPGRRRMWAGGRVRFLGGLRCGEPATRRTQVLSTEKKEGRSGRLTFVTVGHEIVQGGRVIVEERQDSVYRDVHDVTAPEVEAEPTSSVEERSGPDDWSIDITPSLLFRFSALTYNAYRIHWDRGYARNVEGYPGLVTHGPLQALAIAEAARARGLVPADGVTFDYRIVAPLFDHQGLVAGVTADGDGVRGAVRDIAGRQTACATITPAG